MLVHEPEKDADGMPYDVWNGVGDDEVNLQFPLTISTQQCFLNQSKKSPT